MAETDDRLTELEIRYARQQDLLEQLNEELVIANRNAALLQTRVKRLESTVELLLGNIEVPNEKPPHY